MRVKMLSLWGYLTFLVLITMCFVMLPYYNDRLKLVERQSIWTTEMSKMKTTMIRMAIIARRMNRYARGYTNEPSPYSRYPKFMTVT